MRFGRIAAFYAASVFASTLAAPAFAQTPYDGNWHVTIVTKSGTCEPTASSMLTVADGKITNMTKNLGVKFWREDHDSPSTAPPYGNAGWTKDEKYVLLYDHYDIWQVAQQHQAPSASYIARMVQLDSEVALEDGALVHSRQFAYAKGPV